MTDDITKDDLKSELEDLQGKSTVNVTTEVITIREKNDRRPWKFD